MKVPVNFYPLSRFLSRLLSKLLRKNISMGESFGVPRYIFLKQITGEEYETQF